jgi:nucleotide-binding universal stress UspA family protein
MAILREIEKGDRPMTHDIDVENAQDLPSLMKPDPDHDRFLRGVKEILVPTDLTPENHQTVTYAVALALLWNAHLTLLHVYEQPYNLSYLRGLHVCDVVKQHRKDKEHALELLEEEVREQKANCSTVFRQGDHCDEIVKAAHDLQADLMIIGTRAEKWFERIAYGSDADALVRRAGCPVLVVPEHPDHFGMWSNQGYRSGRAKVDAFL